MAGPILQDCANFATVVWTTGGFALELVEPLLVVAIELKFNRGQFSVKRWAWLSWL
jgi:hypothetical protein